MLYNNNYGGIFMNGAKKQSIWESYKFPIILMSSIVAGSIVGLIMGKKATIFKPLGDIFLNGMFTIVVPLVFFTISSAIANMANLKRLGKILKNLLLVFVVTGIIASVLMIIVVNIFPPAQGVNIQTQVAENIKPFNTSEQIVSALTVKDFPELISRKNMMPLIIFSIFFGLCVSMLKEKGKIVSDGLNALSEVFLKMVNLLMYYAPIGLGAYFAALIGEFGPQLLGSYARVIAIYYPICIAYFIVAFSGYSYFAGGKDGVKVFYRNITSPAITSLATQSSIATLPVNLEASKRMGIPKDIREIVLPIGATAHMDGTCLSSILKISFLFGLYSIPFKGIGTYVSAVLLSVLGGVVMSGVPGGGLIGEMLIVNMYGLPAEAFPIIATIGYLVDPIATMINSTGDSVAAMMITRIIEGKDWMKKKLTVCEENNINIM